MCIGRPSTPGIETRQTGARVEEIPQLRCRDFVRIDGVVAMRITVKGPRWVIFFNTAAFTTYIVGFPLNQAAARRTMNIFLSMAAFALAASISPGPVNLVALGSGLQYGFGASMRHVTGATGGFTLLLLLTGSGLRELLDRWPNLTTIVQWAGVAFLLYLAFRLAIDDGRIGLDNSTGGPSLIRGATMQWLNPKAWLASLAGMGAYAASGDLILVWQFAAIYFVICYASIACWAAAGLLLRQYLQSPARVRMLNRLMALMLAGSAAYLLHT